MNSLDDGWKCDRYLALIQELETDIELLSLDIFDTLLFRTCEKPIDVFIKVGEKAKNSGILPTSYTPFEFQQLRIEAERVARTKKHTENSYDFQEVTLEDIYKQLPFTQATQDFILEIELEIESEVCYLNPMIFDLINSFFNRKIPIYLLSDMYLSKIQIERILVTNGLDINMINGIFVSSVEGGSKQSGLLFQKLLETVPYLKPESILHIGDNFLADVKVPQDYSIRVIHYNVLSQEIDDLFSFEKVRYETLLPELFALRRLSSAMVNDKRSDKFWVQFGACVLGPFLSLFADWILDLCLKENKKNVFPLMREGHLLSMVIREAVKHRGESISVEPLYVSRKATFYSVIDDENLEIFFEKVINGHHPYINLRNITIRNFLEMFGFIETEAAQTLRPYFETIILDARNTKFNTSLTLKDYILESLTEESLLNISREYIREKQKFLQNYLTQMIEDVSQAVTVDIGFRGTIQYFLDKALENLDPNGSLLTHLISMGTKATTEKMLAGMDIRGFVGNTGENNDVILSIKRSPEIFEELLMGEDGSTLGYLEKNCGRLYPITGSTPTTKDEIEWKKACAEGVLLFQDMWYHLCNKKPQLKNSLLSQKRQIGMILSRVVDIPTYSEAINLGELTHDDNFGSDHVSSICRDEDTLLMGEMGVKDYLSFTRNGWEYGGTYWPQGVVTKKYPFYFYQSYLQENYKGDYATVLNEMVSRIREAGYQTISIFGAGEAGRKLAGIISLHGLKVEYFIDSNSELWGKNIDGVPIIALNKAYELNVTVFVIGSLAYFNEIRQTIKEKYNKGVEPIIFTPYSLKDVY
ncbi:hypothetical protein [Bacillus sp. AK128]